ncbi:fatty acyl CoA syntetase 1 [Trypanosoma brucei brucei TREU927]|uniref:Fatty acyl CoA syntetase 1 n=2 Tax=Trypanosoma brucei TaxID=5691 RepID=Q38FC0_TRYB2|nr:fatty acyl CoA synthetase 1 [Trypanosoma brucei brucei TREU927]AAF19437.1 fatty acyl CoA synthetase 1 [Trypanosoma brucei]EAN76500.1 fatty acyl CoA syntetase 1 [Trypanosoma brucei brucei TREU927]
MGMYVTKLLSLWSHWFEVDDEVIIARQKFGPLAHICGPAEGENCSPVYRSIGVTDEEQARITREWYYGEHFLKQLEQTCTSRRDTLAVAYRTINKVEKEWREDHNGKRREWQVTHLNDPVYMTYGELWENSVAFGKGLREYGAKEGDRVAIYEDTRWEWLASAIGVWTQLMVTVTVYANLCREGLMHALKETECAAIICNGQNIKDLITLLKEVNLTNTTLVYLDSLPDGLNDEGMRLIPWKQVLETGMKSNLGYTIPGNCDTTALIMYTSGTVAAPKGVMHTFGSLTASKNGLADRFLECIGPKEEGETYVSYLPLAHILEFIADVVMLSRGTLVCFGSPRTLTDDTARPRGDLKEFKPVFIVGVPRIFETIRKVVESRLPPVGSFKRTLFDTAYADRLRALKEGKDTPFWNEKVFKVPRDMFGGRLRGVVCGGAPLADRTQEFMRVVFGLPLGQGYGLTETCCNGSIQRLGELYPSVGQLLKGVEGRLLDTDEYKHTDKPFPRGELCLRGSFMFKGYYKQEAMSKEVLIPGGWFRTGDVVEIGEDNALRVIGRVKALVKNLLGEYIQLEYLEVIYSQHPLSAPNGVCILVNQRRAYICALVITDEERAKKFAQENGIGGTWPEILKDPTFHQRAAKSLSNFGASIGRKPFELLRQVRVIADEWTAKNGMLTVSMKIRRNKVEERYGDVIEQLFKYE